MGESLLPPAFSYAEVQADQVTSWRPSSRKQTGGSALVHAAHTFPTGPEFQPRDPYVPSFVRFLLFKWCCESAGQEHITFYPFQGSQGRITDQVKAMVSFRERSALRTHKRHAWLFRPRVFGQCLRIWGWRRFNYFFIHDFDVFKGEFLNSKSNSNFIITTHFTQEIILSLGKKQAVLGLGMFR